MLIIAEIGQNHNGDMATAKELICAAKESGASIAKFQLYEVDSIFPKDFEWYKETKGSQVSRDQVSLLKETCDKVGIEFFASVFDRERFKWTESVGMQRYKIASRSIYEKDLIDAITKTGKDIIVSLGMHKEQGFPDIQTKGKVDFLYCVAKYPTLPQDLDFEKVDFKKYSGFSDHTIGIEAALIAVGRGARIIEKHFTLDKKMHGSDHSGSMDPKDLRELSYYAKKMEDTLLARKVQ